MIIYLLKSTLLLGLLYGLYKLLLENEKIHHINRFFLLFALAFGLTAPVITFEIYPEQTIAGLKMQQMERVVNGPAEAVSQSVESAIVSKPGSSTKKTETTPITAAESGWPISTTDILLSLYGLITLVLLIRFVSGLFEINKKIKAGSHLKRGPATLVLLNESIIPQSFFKFIFIEKEQFENGRVEPEILDHELIHVRQFHSLDVLIIEFLKVIFWFNPFMYLYKHAIQLNHEFIADESVVSNGSSVSDYQNMLIRVLAGNKQMSTTSSISYSLTKKRLKMMVKKFSVLRSGSKGLFLLLLLLPATLMFCTKNIDDSYSKITNYSEKYYVNVDLFNNYERSKELEIESGGIGILFDSAGNPFTGVHRVRYSKNDRIAFEAIYENGVLKSNTRYNAEGDTLSSYSFGIVGGKFRTVREYNQNGMLVEKWTNPQPDDSLGTIKQWHPNGQLKYEAYFKGNLQYEGLMTLYNKQGDILEQERYEDGELIKKIK